MDFCRFWASFWGNFINISIAFVLLGIGIYLLYNRHNKIKSNNKNVLGKPLHLSIDDKKFNKICVVENIADQWSIENSSIYQGYFHILGGTLSSSTSQRKEDLLIPSLVKRVKKDSIEEVIIATSATVEGQTTAHYIKDSLKDIRVKVSKLAQGLPVGGEIESLDDGTLFSAFKNRSWIENNSD